jgi:uncharacterized protein (UPF0332 family)
MENNGQNKLNKCKYLWKFSFRIYYNLFKSRKILFLHKNYNEKKFTKSS